MSPSGGKNGNKRTIQWEHMAAGLSGGVVSTLALHPLDLIKVRFQGKLQTKWLISFCSLLEINIHVACGHI